METIEENIKMILKNTSKLKRLVVKAELKKIKKYINELLIAHETDILVVEAFALSLVDVEARLCKCEKIHGIKQDYKIKKY